MARFPRPKPVHKRGRPKIDWDPWLEKMHTLILGGETDRRASELIAQRHRHEIPQGSTHGQRSDESAARSLRKHYPSWLEQRALLKKQLADFEELQARLRVMFFGEGGKSTSLEDLSKTFELGISTKLAERMKIDMAQFAQRFEVDRDQWLRAFPNPGDTPFARALNKLIKSQKPSN
jgi:hypothetical protein